MIAISLSPNTEKDDLRLAWKLLWRPWLWRKGMAATKLETEFAQWLGGPTLATAFNSGRTAMYAILSTLGLQPGDEVLLQAFTCVAVPGPVLWAGAKPVYVDCCHDYTMSAEDLKRKLTPRSKVLIIQHTFGLAAHLNELLQIAREHKLFVIEDCAHAMGSKYKGAYVGTFGDAAIFSFGRDKCLSSVFGGLTVTKNKELDLKLKQLALSWGTPSGYWIKKNLSHPIILHISKKLYDVGPGKIILALSIKLGIVSKAVYPQEKLGGKPPFGFKKMPNAMAMLALNQFHKLPNFIAHRKKLAEFYQKALPSEWFAKPVANSESVYLRLPIKVTDPQKILLEAKLRGIELGDWYSQPIAPKGVNNESLQFSQQDCPNATKLSQTTLNLPTSIQIRDIDASRIIDLLK